MNLRSIVLLSLLLFLKIGSVGAQGNIKVKLTDSNYNPIPNQIIVVKNDSVIKSGVTNADGEVLLTYLPEDTTYQVRTIMDDEREWILLNVHIKNSRTTTYNSKIVYPCPYKYIMGSSWGLPNCEQNKKHKVVPIRYEVWYGSYENAKDVLKGHYLECYHMNIDRCNPYWYCVDCKRKF